MFAWICVFFIALCAFSESSYLIVTPAFFKSICHFSLYTIHMYISKYMHIYINSRLNCVCVYCYLLNLLSKYEGHSHICVDMYVVCIICVSICEDHRVVAGFYFLCRLSFTLTSTFIHNYFQRFLISMHALQSKTSLVHTMDMFDVAYM